MMKIKLTISSLVGVFLLSACSSSDNTSKNVTLVKTSTINSKYLTTSDDYTLYSFSNDDENKSNCNGTQVGQCAEVWPPYLDNNLTSIDISNHVGTITRDDNTSQNVYYTTPVYKFKNDGAVGDTNGNFIKNKWNLIYPSSDFNTTDTDPAIKLSATSVKQKYMTDANGVSLYVFDDDNVSNVSVCYNACESSWPVFYADVNANNISSDLNISLFNTVTRSDNKKQISYNGKPLYYFTPDANISGSIKGNWKKGDWHLIQIK